MQHFFTTFSTEGSKISLEALLNAREERAILQQQLITQYGQTLLCITLTAVGGVKKKCFVGLCFYKSSRKSDRTFYSVKHHSSKRNSPSVRNGA
ncbi:citrate lyase holo-[acyl-carrier protein] synthase [Haemophilus influenzae]|uniref:citrate lyase holo-[acyl-carrier protein] synthase n=1 Tax=Haemophilus influenzae TaxID=727 RepID=UPI003C6D0446